MRERMFPRVEPARPDEGRGRIGLEHKFEPVAIADCSFPENGCCNLPGLTRRYGSSTREVFRARPTSSARPGSEQLPWRLAGAWIERIPEMILYECEYRLAVLMSGGSWELLGADQLSHALRDNTHRLASRSKYPAGEASSLEEEAVWLRPFEPRMVDLLAGRSPRSEPARSCSFIMKAVDSIKHVSSSFLV